MKQRKHQTKDTKPVRMKTKDIERVNELARVKKTTFQNMISAIINTDDHRQDIQSIIDAGDNFCNQMIASAQANSEFPQWVKDGIRTSMHAVIVKSIIRGEPINIENLYKRPDDIGMFVMTSETDWRGNDRVKYIQERP